MPITGGEAATEIFLEKVKSQKTVALERASRLLLGVFWWCHKFILAKSCSREHQGNCASLKRVDVFVAEVITRCSRLRQNSESYFWSFDLESRGSGPRQRRGRDVSSHANSQISTCMPYCKRRTYAFWRCLIWWSQVRGSVTGLEGLRRP